MTTTTKFTRAMELLVAYSRNPSIDLRNQLVKINAGLVRKVAHQISKQCTEPYEDLEQIGYIGLIQAVERFDPRQGYAFSSFAVPYIRGEILHFLRDKGSVMRIPRRWQELNLKAKKIRKKLTVTLGRLPNDYEIAQELGVPLKEWYECQLAEQNRLLLSLDATVSQTLECALSLGETLPDPNYQARQKLQEDRQQIEGALDQLEEKNSGSN